MADDVPGSTVPQADTTAIFGAINFEALAAAHAAGVTAEVQAAVESLPPTSAMLVVLSGPNVGSRFLLDADKTLAGRSMDADILLDDVTVSRRHAEFLREGTVFSVHDLGSLNGTYVNRALVDSVVLATGDEVQIGKYRLTFQASLKRVEHAASE